MSSIKTRICTNSGEGSTRTQVELTWLDAVPPPPAPPLAAPLPSSGSLLRLRTSRYTSAPSHTSTATVTASLRQTRFIFRRRRPQPSRRLSDAHLPAKHEEASARARPVEVRGKRGAAASLSVGPRLSLAHTSTRARWLGLFLGTPDSHVRARLRREPERVGPVSPPPRGCEGWSSTC